jgi:hypothetical protein
MFPRAESGGNERNHFSRHFKSSWPSDFGRFDGLKMSSRLNSEALQAPEEYLTIEELSARLKIKPKTIKNKMASGILRKGIHYFSPPGLGPRFKWSAVVAWLEQSQEPHTGSDDDAIPMARGYRLGSANACIELSDNIIKHQQQWRKE